MVRVHNTESLSSIYRYTPLDSYQGLCIIQIETQDVAEDIIPTVFQGEGRLHGHKKESKSEKEEIGFRLGGLIAEPKKKGRVEDPLPFFFFGLPRFPHEGVSFYDS